MRKYFIINIFFINLLLLLCMEVQGQFYFQLNYDELGVLFRPKKIPDTATFLNSKRFPNQKLIIYLLSEKGESHFIISDKQNQPIIIGNFANSIDTLSKYIFLKSKGFNDGKSHYSVSVIKYFQPLKVGTWIYYGKNRKVKRKEVYEFINE